MTDSIERELAMSGSVSPTTHASCQLEACRITTRMDLPPMVPLFKYNSVPCFYRGELHGIAGKAKSGETFFTSVLMACCVKSGILGIERIQEQLLHVMWFDTEQSMQSTQEILRDRIVPLVGGVEEYPEALFDIFNVRSVDWDKRMALLREGVRTCRPDLVVVDGIRDLVDDINNGVLAQAVIADLMNIATEYDCCVLCVIHQNKTGEDRNLRGWIGTELTNKGFEIWSCEKLIPDHIFSVEQTLTRKQGVEKILYFTIDDNGLPVASDGPSQEAASTLSSQKNQQKLPPFNQEYIIHHDKDDSYEVDIRKLFYETLKNGAMFYTPMQQKAMALLNCHETGYWNSIFLKAKNMGIVQNTTVNHKSMWALPEQKEPELSHQELDMFQQKTNALEMD